jgi:hypothetical protein
VAAGSFGPSQIPRPGESGGSRKAVETVEDRDLAADIAPTAKRQRQARQRSGLSLSAWAFLVLIAAGALAPSWFAIEGAGPLSPKEWTAFALIAVGAALAQLFPVVTPRDQSYHTTMVVLVPAVLLLPTWMLPLVVVAQHLPEWVKVRYPWYIQMFNASNSTCSLRQLLEGMCSARTASSPGTRSGSLSPGWPRPSFWSCSII